MKLSDLFEEDREEMELDPTRGAGYKDDAPAEKRRLSTHLLRRKAEKNNPVPDDTHLPEPNTNTDTGDDPDSEKGQGLQ